MRKCGIGSAIPPEDWFLSTSATINSTGSRRLGQISFPLSCVAGQVSANATYMLLHNIFIMKSPHMTTQFIILSACVLGKYNG